MGDNHVDRFGHVRTGTRERDVAVRTGRATVLLSSDPSQSTLELAADARSLRAREGSGGVQPLDAGARARIDQTINDEVLKGTAIAFRSREVSQAHDGGLFVSGALELAGATHPISFDLQIGDDGQVSGSAVVKQNEWGMKPYTALFGTLKVADEVHVSIDGRLAVRQ